MVSRTAYAQLRYSPLLLAGTVLGLALTYLAPVALALFADGLAQYLGLVAWLLMAFAFRPTLRFYRLSPLWGLALPAIAAIYMAFTLDSAYQHARGRGGMWKGRAQVRANVQSQCFGTAMNDAAYARDCDRARATGTRISRWRPGSFLRAIAAPILAFYNFVRTADDIADHATLPAAEKLALLDRLDAGLTGQGRQRRGRGAAARRARRAQAFAEACAGSARRVQARRHQAALPRLGRSDRLLLAFGHAGRPLRLRRAWREPRLLAGQRCAVRGACRSSITCRIAGRTIAISTASMFRSTRSPPRHDGRGARRAARLAARC